MQQYIAHISLLVHDYDEAIDFYTRKLDFLLLEDTRLNAEKRWVRVAPRGEGSCSLLPAKAVGNVQKSQIGHQSGGPSGFSVSLYR